MKYKRLAIHFEKTADSYIVSIHQVSVQLVTDKKQEVFNKCNFINGVLTWPL